MAFRLDQGDVEKNTYRTTWVVAPTKAGDPAIDVGDGGETSLRPGVGGRILEPMARWSPDGRWIAYLVKQNGEVQLWRSRIDGAIQEQLTRSDADVKDFRWSEDGQRLYFTVPSESRATMRSTQETEARRGYLIDNRFDFRDSMVPNYNRNQGTDVWTYETATSSARIATAAETKEFANLSGALKALIKITKVHPSEEFDPAIFGRKIAFAQVVLPPDRVMSATAVVSAASADSPGTSVQCGHPACKGIIVQTWWSSDGRQVYFERGTENWGTYGEYYSWSPTTGTVRRLFTTESWLDGCTVEGKRGVDRLICHSESPTQPGTIISVDLQTGATTTLTDPNPEFRAVQLTEVERLQWRTDLGDGIIDDAIGYLIKPRGYQPGQRYPLVIQTKEAVGFLQPYGGGAEYPAHVFADKGLMVFICNKPYATLIKLGSPRGYFNDFQEARHVHESLEAGIRILEQRGLIDSKRIALTGFSAGGEASMHALFHSKRQFAAVILSSTSWEPFGFYRIPRKERLAFEEITGITIDKDGPTSWFYEALAPSKNVEKIEAPILFHNADREMIPALQTLAVMDKYRKPYEAYVFPDEWHIKTQPAHLQAIWRRNVQWMQFWLTGTEVNDPVDPDQYVRWRKLREMHKANASANSQLSSSSVSK